MAVLPFAPAAPVFCLVALGEYLVGPGKFFWPGLGYPTSRRLLEIVLLVWTFLMD